MPDQTKSASPDETPSSSRKRFFTFSIRGALVLTTLIFLVFYFFIPNATIQVDVLAIAPPYPQSRVDVLQFEGNSMVSKVVLKNVLVSRSFQPQLNTGSAEKTKPYVVWLRLTGLQRTQYFRLLQSDSQVYLQPARD